MKICFVWFALVLLSFAVNSVTANSKLKNLSGVIPIVGTGSCLDTNGENSQDLCGGSTISCLGPPPPGSPVGIDCGDFFTPSGLLVSMVEWKPTGFLWDINGINFELCYTKGVCRTRLINGVLKCNQERIEHWYLETANVDYEKACSTP